MVATEYITQVGTETLPAEQLTDCNRALQNANPKLYAPILDLARLMGATGVVLHHVHSSASFQPFLASWDPLRVPLFLTISAYLAAASTASPTKSLRVALSPRLLAIALPYAFWTVAYSLLAIPRLGSLENLVKIIIHQWPAYLFYGRAECHLYYLPLTAMVFFAVTLLRKASLSMGALASLCMACLACNVLLGSDPRVLSVDRNPIVRLTYFSGVVGAFAAAGMLIASGPVRGWLGAPSKAAALVLIGFGIIVAVGLWPWVALKPVLFLVVPVITLIGLLKLPNRGKWKGHWKFIAKSYFGVYLIHMVFIQVAALAGLTRNGAIFDHDTAKGPLLLAFLTLILSIACTVSIQQFLPRLAPLLVGGRGNLHSRG